MNNYTVTIKDELGKVVYKQIVESDGRLVQSISQTIINCMDYRSSEVERNILATQAAASRATIKNPRS